MSSWWDQNLPRRLAEFTSWTGNPQSATKRYIRQHVVSRGYQSFLDAGAGLCVQWDALQSEVVGLQYQALDSCEYLVQRARARGVPIDLGSVEQTPYQAAQFDVVVAQHVLEHLPHFGKALIELARVARKELLVVFFLAPGNVEVLQQRRGLWNNTYRDKDVSQAAAALPRYVRHHWHKVHRDPSNGIEFDHVLHVELKEP